VKIFDRFSSPGISSRQDVTMMRSPVQELKAYLKKGISLDELWRVARGEIRYSDFTSTQSNGAATAAPPQIPDELVLPSFCFVPIFNYRPLRSYLLVA
jgi:hypothetical protein